MITDCEERSDAISVLQAHAARQSRWMRGRLLGLRPLRRCNERSSQKCSVR